MYALAWLSPGDWKRRLVLALVAGVDHRRLPRGDVAAVPAEARAYLARGAAAVDELREGGAAGVSPRLARRDADRRASGHRHDRLGCCSPGCGGATADLLRRILGVAAPCFAASLLLLWQTRTGPAAQMLAAVGAAVLAWSLFPLFWRREISARFGSLGAVVAVIVWMRARSCHSCCTSSPKRQSTACEKAIGRANNLCASMWGLHPIALEPKGLVFTYVDLGPRLITLTHHDAIAGPYHRNYQQIVDVMNAWRGSEAQAHQIIVDKYHSNYVLSCPKSSTTTIFMSEAPKGFYGQLEAGKVPNWLQPVAAARRTCPFKMWRVVG